MKEQAVCPDFSTPKSSKNCEKAQEKAKFFLKILHFWTFQGGFTFSLFFRFFQKIFKFYYTQFSVSQKAPLFSVFALCANCKKYGAKVGQKAPLLRQIARSGHFGKKDFDGRRVADTFVLFCFPLFFPVRIFVFPLDCKKTTRDHTPRKFFSSL